MNWIVVPMVLITMLPLRVFSDPATPSAAPSRIHKPVYKLRFSDIAPALPLNSNHLQATPANAASPAPLPEAPALPWLKQHGWKKVWPRFGLGKKQPLVFAGPKEARYLRLDADNAYYIWTKPLQIDVHKWPILKITWGMERFAEEAALDVYERNDRPLAVIVSFGEKLVGNNPFFPHVPRGLAFFWGETETIGQSYTCIQPRIGPQDELLQCRYPHVHYIALRRSQASSVHTEYVNLIEHFQHYFPEYWKTHQRIPPVVAISFEAGTKKTHTFSQSQLYALTFLQTMPDQPSATEERP